MIDFNKVDNLKFDGIDHSDYPDFCDAYICEADYNGDPASEEELNEINEDRDFVYKKLMEHLF